MKPPQGLGSSRPGVEGAGVIVVKGGTDGVTTKVSKSKPRGCTRRHTHTHSCARTATRLITHACSHTCAYMCIPARLHIHTHTLHHCAWAPQWGPADPVHVPHPCLGTRPSALRASIFHLRNGRHSPCGVKAPAQPQAGTQRPSVNATRQQAQSGMSRGLSLGPGTFPITTTPRGACPPLGSAHPCPLLPIVGPANHKGH